MLLIAEGFELQISFLSVLHSSGVSCCVTFCATKFVTKIKCSYLNSYLEVTE